MADRDVDTAGPEHRLEALSNMSDCQLAEGTPDIRGWEVTSPTSAHLGIVQDLLVDLASFRVRYLDITLDASPSPARRVLLPIGKAWINDALDEVVVPTSPSLETLPAYDPGRFDHQFEQDVLAAFGDMSTADFHTGSAFDVTQARAQHVTCARRATDPDGVRCPIQEAPINGTEAANGVELSIVAEAAD